MEDWVHFLGHVENPAQMLLESDVVLNPSGSRAGGTVDLLADERDGHLVTTGDAAGLYREL